MLTIPAIAPLCFLIEVIPSQRVVFKSHIFVFQGIRPLSHVRDALVSLSFSLQDGINLRTVPSSTSVGANTPRVEFLCDYSVTKPFCVMHMRDEFVNADLSNLVGLVVGKVA